MNNVSGGPCKGPTWTLSPEPWHLRLRQARAAAGITLAELGSRLKPPLDRRAIHAMEQGRRALDVELCAGLAWALGVSPVWLAGLAQVGATVDGSTVVREEWYGNWYRCPSYSCGSHNVRDRAKHCDNCGVPLDWSAVRK